MSFTVQLWGRVKPGNLCPDGRGRPPLLFSKVMMSRRIPVADAGVERKAMICDECQALYEEVGDRVREARVFAKVRRNDEALICRARDVESEANYLAEVADTHDVVWVGLYTPDRWLSESIETDLLHQGDKLEDLLEDELVELGFEARLPVEHFRDDQKQYVFRSPVFLPAGEKLEGEGMVDRVTKVLLGYEAMFRQLGDMAPTDDDDL